MAAITVHVVGDDWSQLWLFKTHTARSVAAVQQGRVKYCIPLIMANAQHNCYRPLDTLIYKYTYNFKVGIRMPVQELQHKTHNEIKVEIINMSILLLPPLPPPPLHVQLCCVT